MANGDTAEFTLSRELRNGTRTADAATAIGCVDALRKQLAFGEARLLAEHIREHLSPSGKAAFQLMRLEVTCTYKDPELPPDVALSRALTLLESDGRDLQTTTDPEVLGLAGAIWKRRWEYDGHVEHLQKALEYYQRGYGGVVATADGYPAINTAYILDLLGGLALKSGGIAHTPASAKPNEFAAASAIRRELTKYAEDAPPTYGVNDYWYLATIGEAYLGLEDPRAEDWLRRAVALPSAEDWKLESTARQLAGLVEVLHRASGHTDPVETSARWTMVRRAFGESSVAGLRSALIGKVGLALSGGGFRASLYHIGVLARLAELDVLRHIEVLSCVSGGSIVGAHYYLELRSLLQRKADDAISRDDYIEIVKRIEEHFVRGVQSDLRNRLLADRAASARSAIDPTYTRTHRLGELYESELYAKVEGDRATGPRFINSLYIEPAASPSDRRDPTRAFNPRLDNWRRRAKVPVLVLNATSLNTGHVWQFTASWMGEPPSAYDPAISSTPRLRRLRYQDAPKAHREVRLGHAVAASSCVPGLFDPIVLAGLYEQEPAKSGEARDVEVRLVDGGVYDNQGTAGLLEQNCTVLLVSDGSGQLLLSDRPGGDPLSVGLRSNEVSMARVREAEFHLVSRLRQASVLRGLVYVHLRQGLSNPPMNWIGCTDPPDPASMSPQTVLTPYGMRADVQALLAGLRTDLDAFSDLEAFGLMQSGYLATRHSLPGNVPEGLGCSDKDAVPVNWRFQSAAGIVATEDQPLEVYKRAVAHLERGRLVSGRTLPLIPPLWIDTAKGMLAAAAIAVALGLVFATSVTLMIIGLLTTAGAVGTALAIWWLSRQRTRVSWWQRVTGRAISAFGWQRAQQQVDTGTPRYLADGRLEQFTGSAPS